VTVFASHRRFRSWSQASKASSHTWCRSWWFGWLITLQASDHISHHAWTGKGTSSYSKIALLLRVPRVRSFRNIYYLKFINLETRVGIFPEKPTYLRFFWGGLEIPLISPSGFKGVLFSIHGEDDHPFYQTPDPSKMSGCPSEYPIAICLMLDVDPTK